MSYEEEDTCHMRRREWLTESTGCSDDFNFEFRGPKLNFGTRSSLVLTQGEPYICRVLLRGGGIYIGGVNSVYIYIYIYIYMKI
jgi:hypothetical protein